MVENRSDSECGVCVWGESEYMCVIVHKNI